jgi:hypothetical protein
MRRRSVTALALSVVVSALLVSSASATQFAASIKGSGATTTLRLRLTNLPASPSSQPLSTISFTLPRGVSIRTTGFAICPASTLDTLGPSGCPRSAVAGPTSQGLIQTMAGQGTGTEGLTTQPFFLSGAAFSVFLNGEMPVSFQESAFARVAGNRLILTIPPVVSVPNASSAAFVNLGLSLSASRTALVRRDGKLTKTSVPLVSVQGHGKQTWQARLGFQDGTQSVVRTTSTY